MSEQIFVRTNLSYLRKKQGLTQVALSDKLGIKQSLLSNYESGRLEVPLAIVANAAQVLGINLSDFMLKDLTKSNIYTTLHMPDALSMVQEPAELYKVSDSATPFFEVQVNASDNGMIDYTKEKASGYFVNIPALRQAEAAFSVSGFSMEPEINNGDIIGVRQLQAWDYVDTAQVYLLITQQERMIKRLKPDDADDAHLWCISPNYAPFKIPKTDILRLFRVVACISLL